LKLDGHSQAGEAGADDGHVEACAHAAISA